MIFHEYFRSWGGEKFPIWLIYYWQTTHIFTQQCSIADSAPDQFHCKIQSSLHNSFQDPVWIWISEHHRSKVETRKVWAIIRFNKTVRIDFNIEQGVPNLSQNKLNILQEWVKVYNMMIQKTDRSRRRYPQANHTEPSLLQGVLHRSIGGEAENDVEMTCQCCDGGSFHDPGRRNSDPRDWGLAYT